MLLRIFNHLRRRIQQRRQAALRRSEHCLKVLLFHGVYDSPQEQELDQVDRGLFAKLEQVAAEIQCCRDEGFEFVRAEDIPRIRGGRKAVLTFDDGYANNLLLLPLLAQLQVPATVFVVTSAVLDQECFWWDVLARNAPPGTRLSHSRQALKRLAPPLIRRQLRELFGEDCLQARNASDRPLSPDELRLMASNPWISIGNHTHDHGLLNQMSDGEAVRQLSDAQHHFEKLLGRSPSLLAYPNGRYNRRIQELACQLGFEAAFTTCPEWTPLPLRGSLQRMAIGRIGPCAASP